MWNWLKSKPNESERRKYIKLIIAAAVLILAIILAKLARGQPIIG